MALRLCNMGLHEGCSQLHTSPSESTSGPPLFPGLIGASVWTKILGSSSRSCLAGELTIPMLIELSIPSGLPKASADLSLAEEAFRAGASGFLLNVCDAEEFVKAIHGGAAGASVSSAWS
jgi:hypothetical protein